METTPLSVACPLFVTLSSLVASKRNLCSTLHWTVSFPCFWWVSFWYWCLDYWLVFSFSRSNLAASIKLGKDTVTFSIKAANIVKDCHLSILNFNLPLWQRNYAEKETEYILRDVPACFFFWFSVKLSRILKPPLQEAARSKWGDKFGFLLISSGSHSFLNERGHHKRANDMDHWHSCLVQGCSTARWRHNIILNPG